MTRVTAVPEHLLAYASSLEPAERSLGTDALALDDVLDEYRRRCTYTVACPTISGAALARHVERGATLAEWVGAVGIAFDRLDTGFVGYLPGTPRSADLADLVVLTEALGAFPLLEQAEAWRGGLAHARSIHALIAAGEGQAAADALAALAEHEDSDVYLRAALLALGDLSALEEAIDDATPKGSLAGRFFGGAWDAVSGTAGMAWDLTGRLVHDPGGWAGSWGDLGSAVWWGVQNPGDFALVVIDWEGLKDDPVRWLGGLAPEAVAAVATAGGSAAVTASGRGASAARGAMRGLRSATRLGDRIEAMRQLARAIGVDVEVGARTAGGRTVRWTPAGTADAAGDLHRIQVTIGDGPLSRLTAQVGHPVTDTFRSGTYLTHRTSRPLTLYRVSTPGSSELGSYWTAVPPAGPIQSQIDSALQPAWRNTAERITEIRVPAGEVVYEGLAGPQPLVPGGSSAPTDSLLLGGGHQVFLPNVPPDWVVDVRPIGGGAP